VSRNRIADIDVGFGADAPTVTLSGTLGRSRKIFMRNCTFLPSRNAHPLLSEMASRRARPTGRSPIDRPEIHRKRKDLKWRRDLLDGTRFMLRFRGREEVTAISTMLPLCRQNWIQFQHVGDGKIVRRQLEHAAALSTGYGSDQLTYTASLRLPAGWKFGTSLHVASQAGNDILQPVSRARGCPDIGERY